jgi:hypothetical protein
MRGGLGLLGKTRHWRIRKEKTDMPRVVRKADIAQVRPVRRDLLNQAGIVPELWNYPQIRPHKDIWLFSIRPYKRLTECQKTALKRINSGRITIWQNFCSTIFQTKIRANGP